MMQNQNIGVAEYGIEWKMHLPQPFLLVTRTSHTYMTGEEHELG